MGGEGTGLESASQCAGTVHSVTLLKRPDGRLWAPVVLKIQTFEWGAPTAVGAVASTPWATAGPRRAEPASTALLARRSAFSSGIAEHFFLMLTTEVGTKASRHAVAV